MTKETIVLVYSLSGKALHYAQALAQKENAKCVRIETKHPSNVFGYMLLGYAAVLRRPVHLKPIHYDFSGVDRCILVVITSNEASSHNPQTE